MSTSRHNGLHVVSFESRLSEETAALIRKHGAEPISAPSMQEVPLDSHQAVFDFAEQLFEGRIDTLILMTGVGTRMLLEAMETRYDRADVESALGAIDVIARGPKPVRVLKEEDLPFTFKVREPNTWEEILTELDEHDYSVSGRTVAVQEYGRSNDAFYDALEERGATVVQVPIYRWTLPDDREPLKRALDLLAKGRIELVLFTSRQQIEHVLQVAAEEGLEEAVRRALNRTFVASVGPICTEGLTSNGISVNFEPDRPKLGILVNQAMTQVKAHLASF